MPARADEFALGIVVALQAEAVALSRARIDDRAVVVAGIGCRRAQNAAARTLQRGARALVSFGVCGGLSPRLRRGDLLLPRRIVSDLGEWCTHDAWRARLLCALPDAQEIDVLYSSAAPVSSVEEKHTLFARNCEAVDMESAGVAQAAQRAGVPFFVVKAVCDPASRTVPAIATRLLHRDGRLHWHAAVAAVFSGPHTWRELRALRDDFVAARAGLKRAAQALPRAAEGFAP